MGGRPVKSYAILKSKGNHKQVEKESGQTNHTVRRCDRKILGYFNT
jgi:hypothetical protein